ncbi:response regulator [Effusibacillus dendaii]|uniref:Uncharacterized protein n=1 Tax=Effusibacillus dendaii TaxID=2743772 RepID=A0A7I8DDP3_9BACL|nr:hypothetical protein [Effusibacillus dendaii]BCJ87079.1 hypothetical protein skT53_20640 [Effusibacillus dendaii]
MARVLQLELLHEGYKVRLAEDGRKGLDLALSESWDRQVGELDILLESQEHELKNEIDPVDHDLAVPNSCPV